MTCTWSGSWCARLMRCWPALLFHFFRKSGFWVACQVLFAKILTNFMSALFIRRCWCFGPRPAGQSIFATTAFSQLMMLLSERGFAEEVDVLAKPVFLFIYFLFQSRSIFFSCSVRNMYYIQQEEYFILQKEKSHQFITKWRERKKGTQVMTGIFSHLLFMSSARVWSLTIYQVSALSFLNILI